MPKKTPLDIYDDMPSEMRSYLRHNGWHFNKKACEYAVNLMLRRNPSTNRLEKIEPISKDRVDSMLTKNNILLENNTGYDYVYVANVCKADYSKSIPDEPHMALFIKETIDDPDAGDGTTMRRWYASMVAAGEPVEWDELI